MKNKVDKRIIKTKQRLIKGFSELLQAKSLELIKVSELTRVSNVNRATFYLHYDDIQDFLKSTEEDLISEFTMIFENYSMYMDSGGTIPVICALFEFISSNSLILSAILSPNGDSSLQYRLSLIVREKVSKEFMSQGHENPLDIYSIYYTINGCTGVILKWITSGMKESHEYMSQIIQQFIRCGTNLNP